MDLEDVAHDIDSVAEGVPVSPVHRSYLVSQVVRRTECLFHLQVYVGLEEESPEQFGALLIVVVFGGLSLEAESLLDATEEPVLVVTTVLHSPLHAVEELSLADNGPLLFSPVVLFSIGLEFAEDGLHNLKEVDVVEPLGHALALLVALAGVLVRQHSLVLQHVTLDQVPVLQLLPLDILFLPALLGSFTLLLKLDLLNFVEVVLWNAQFVLLAQRVDVFHFASVQLQLESPRLFLLFQHLPSELLKGVICRILLEIVIFSGQFLESGPPMTLWVRELDPNADRATLHRVEANVDVACFERLGHLVIGVYKEDIL